MQNVTRSTRPSATRSIPAHDLKPGDVFRVGSTGRFRVAIDGPRVGFAIVIPFESPCGPQGFPIASITTLVEIL